MELQSGVQPSQQEEILKFCLLWEQQPLKKATSACKNLERVAPAEVQTGPCWASTIVALNQGLLVVDSGL